ncbi:hypothetical protein [Microviridae sp.]|nr:hypothetical protein [Microviridae sp.]
MEISALCVQSNSIYHQLGINSYDLKTNARTFTGTGPVIAHPPCRGYFAFLSHRAKPRPGEKDIAYFCLENVTRNGGVLEHPAHSRFINYLRDDPKWQIIEIHQQWFGFPTTKRTWLLMPSWYQLIELPFSLIAPQPPLQTIENLSKNQRSRTTLQLATWLINLIEANHDNIQTRIPSTLNTGETL